MVKKNKFKFKFTVAVIILLIVSLILFVSGSVINVLQIIGSGEFENAKRASSIVSLAICVISSIFLTAVLFNSKYTVKNDALYLVLGFLVIKKRLDDISEVVYYPVQNKLVAFFKDDRFTVIMISPKNYEKFGKTISNAGKTVSFTQSDE